MPWKHCNAVTDTRKMSYTISLATILFLLPAGLTPKAEKNAETGNQNFRKLSEKLQ